MSSAAGIAAGPDSTARLPLQVMDLQRITGRELDPLLLEETVEWQSALDWDFSQSAELVRHYTDSRSLAGAALLDRGEVIGYGYAVIEPPKALIGDIYVRPHWRNSDAELTLYRMILDGLTGVTAVDRIESQLMLIPPPVAAALSRERPLLTRDRLLMSAECSTLLAASRLPADREARLAQQFRIEPWSDHCEDPAASLIAAAYSGHVDSDINDQYRDPAGARRFLYNIVRYPGCGVFHKQASVVAVDRQTGWLVGMAAVSFVAPAVGHITQLCVYPNWQGHGLGFALLVKAVEALERAGARRVSLTVTAQNQPAVDLYRRTGFRAIREFTALVWERAGERKPVPQATSR